MATVYCDSAATGSGTGADWANAFTTLSAAITSAASAGIVYLASSHNEVAVAAVTFTSGGSVGAPCKIYSVNKAGSVPPVAADLTVGALFSINAATANLTMAGSLYFYGTELRIGVSQSTTCSIVFGTGGGQAFTMEGCKLTLASTGVSSRISTANSNSPSVHLINCTMKFGATGHAINASTGRIIWRDTASAIDAGGSIPTALFVIGNSTTVQLERLDLSQLNSANQLCGTGSVATVSFVVKDCKFGASFTPGNSSSQNGGLINITRSGSATSDDNVLTSLDGGLAMLTDKVMYRTGGASADNTVPFSWRFTPTANNLTYWKARGPDIEIYNTLTGASHTVTMYGVANTSAIPTNFDLWLEACALQDSTSPLKTMVSSAPATILTTATNQTADTSAWDTGLTARGNTTAYIVGDRIKVATNPGRVFFCTAAGTSAGSEPAGYASAVDGGSVTDSGATFRAGWRFRMAVTLGTIDRAGLIIAWTRFGINVANNYWIDPDVVIA